jgi:hypothetical protein
MRRHLTVEEASRTIGFLQTGLSQCQVGAQFNVGHTVIGRLWTLNNRLIVYNGDRKVADLKVRQAHQDRRITLLRSEIGCHQPLC